MWAHHQNHFNLFSKRRWWHSQTRAGWCGRLKAAVLGASAAVQSRVCRRGLLSHTRKQSSMKVLGN